MKAENIFYEFFVRGEFDDPTRLGQIKGAFVHFWPMTLDDSGAIIMRGELEKPRPLAADDPLPKPIADVINVVALATVNRLTAENDALSKDLDKTRVDLAAARETCAATKADNDKLRAALKIAAPAAAATLAETSPAAALPKPN